jgi:hypothetical protein
MSKQTSITSIFAKANVNAKANAKAKADEHESVPITESKKLASTDPLVQEFYDQLSPNEVIAHSIAVDKLGTSYDVTRTHGFVRWSKSRSTS